MEIKPTSRLVLNNQVNFIKAVSEVISEPDKTIEVGQKIKAKIVKVDTNNKKIALSIKAYEENLDLEAIKLEQNQLEALKEEDSI